jgi:hypothetical protein
MQKREASNFAAGGNRAPAGLDRGSRPLKFGPTELDGQAAARRWGGQSLPTITSVALITAITESPTLSSRLSAESFVIAATTSSPPAKRITTVDITAPRSTRVTVPGSWLRALILMPPL